MRLQVMCLPIRGLMCGLETTVAILTAVIMNHWIQIGHLQTTLSGSFRKYSHEPIRQNNAS